MVHLRESSPEDLRVTLAPGSDLASFDGYDTDGNIKLCSRSCCRTKGQAQISGSVVEDSEPARQAVYPKPDVPDLSPAADPTSETEATDMVTGSMKRRRVEEWVAPLVGSIGSRNPFYYVYKSPPPSSRPPISTPISTPKHRATRIQKLSYGSLPPSSPPSLSSTPCPRRKHSSLSDKTRLKPLVLNPTNLTALPHAQGNKLALDQVLREIKTLEQISKQLVRLYTLRDALLDPNRSSACEGQVSCSSHTK